MKIMYYHRAGKLWRYSGIMPEPDEAYWLNVGLLHRFHHLSSWRKKG